MLPFSSVRLYSLVYPIFGQLFYVHGGGNMTAGGGNIVQQLKLHTAVAELIDNKKMLIIACEPSMTDPDTQCVVANLEMR